MSDRTAAEFAGEALAASVEGDHERAAGLFRKALERTPDSAPLHYNLALELAASNRLDEARRNLKAAARLDEDDADALAELGHLEISEDRLGAAVSALDEALRRVPGHPAALNNRGVAAFLKGRYPEAVNFFRKAVEADPESADAWFNLADACDEAGDAAGASEARSRFRELEA